MAPLLRRTPFAALLVGAALVCAPSPANAAAKPVAAVSVSSCKTGSAVADRTAVFRATMKTITGTDRLLMRFRLQARAAPGSYESVDGRGLGKWRKSKPGVGAFAYSQRVKALAVGSTYRMVVDYRWQSKAGKVIEHSRRISKTCRQGEALPNLTVQKVTASRIDGKPRQAQYTVTVVNRGAAPSPASNLRLLVDGSTERRASVPALMMGQAARLIATAPRCNATMGAQVDPDGLVRESRETDNVRSLACPFGS